jgi:hypothetical protein
MLSSAIVYSIKDEHAIDEVQELNSVRDLTIIFVH